MQFADGKKTKAYARFGIPSRQTWMQVVNVLGLTILYVALFHPLTIKIGPVVGSLIAIPVALAGWYFGVNGGLIASLFGIMLSILLVTNFNKEAWFTWITISWPGYLMVAVVGYITGRIRKELVERSQLLSELRSRERYLTLLNTTTQDILNPKHPEDQYHYLISHLVNLFIADSAHLVRWDETQERAVLVASTTSLARPFPETILTPNASGLTMSVLQTGRTLGLDDVPNSHYVISPASLEKHTTPIQSALCIPLIAKGNKLGAVTLTFNNPRNFSPEEITYADRAGSQIAIALWTVRQESEIKRKLGEANTLANIERALSETEHVGIGKMLQLIVDSAKRLIPGTEQVVLHLIDHTQNLLIPQAIAGSIKAHKEKLNMRLGEGVAGRALATGKTIIVSDVETDERFLDHNTPIEFRSLMVAPIQSGKEGLGTISIQSGQPYAFTQNDSRLLSTLGTEAAIAIENARLFEATQQGLKEVNALYQITRKLAGSLDTNQLMRDVVDLLQQNFGYYHAQIYLLDAANKKFVMEYGSGETGAKMLKSEHRLPMGVGIVGHVAETALPFYTNDVDEVLFFVRNPLLPHTQSELAVPVKIEEKVVGVLDIQNAPPNIFTDRDLQLMLVIADQFAVAIHQANLYANLQESLTHEQAMRTQLVQSERLALIGRLLASVSHELNNPLQAIQNALYLLKDELDLSGQARQDLNIILSETERMALLIGKLRETYRPLQAKDFEQINLNHIIEDVHALISTHMRHKEISFQFHPDLNLPDISGISNQMRQVALNLFLNAVEAMPPDGSLTVTTEATPDKHEILMCVRDTGPGIEPEILSHIFDPFVTSKSTGTGLGLAITHDIVIQHGGRIQAMNDPKGGATFKVWLPAEKREKV